MIPVIYNKDNLLPIRGGLPYGVPCRIPVHPGRFLERNYFLPLRLSQTEVASCLGISRRRVNEIIQGHRAISVDTALRCAIAFQMSAIDLLTMQAEWEGYKAWRQLKHNSTLHV